MICRECGRRMLRTARGCPECKGKRASSRGKIPLIVPSLIISLAVAAGAFFFLNDTYWSTFQGSVHHLPERAVTAKEDMSFSLPQFIAERDMFESTEEMIGEVQESVFAILTPEEQGSGFLYNDEGVVVTSAHVVREHTAASVVTGEGEYFEAEVLGTSDFMDVAVLHVPEFVGIEPFQIDHDGMFSPGENVVAVGSTHGHEYTVAEGSISNTELDLSIDPYQYEDIYEVSAEIVEGKSGGPLVSEDGQSIIAMNVAKSLDSPGVGYSVPIYKIDDMIADLSA